jgi:flagellar basal-body rod protein FlgB
MEISDERVKQLVEKALDFRMQRHGLIAGNMANINTPGYRSKDISFENKLKAAVGSDVLSMKKTHKDHLSHTEPISGITPDLVVPNQPAVKNDLNSVDLEKELGKMGRNNLMYSFLLQALNRKNKLLEYSITESGA